MALPRTATEVLQMSKPSAYTATEIRMVNDYAIDHVKMYQEKLAKYIQDMIGIQQRDIMMGSNYKSNGMADALRYVQAPGLCNEIRLSGATNCWPPAGSNKFDWIGEENMKDPRRKWKFNALHEDLIDFELVSEELDGENPVAFLEHGDTERYVILGAWLLTKARILKISGHPEITNSMSEKSYHVYKISGNFGEWVKWVKKIKSTPWPENKRQHNTVEVSLPKI